MASPFLNPLHSYLAASPSLSGQSPLNDDDIKLFSLQEDNQIGSPHLATDKDDLSVIASHLSLNSPIKRTSSPRYPFSYFLFSLRP